jgi:hypothetical protein
VVAAGSVLLSTTSACGSTTVVDCCVNCNTSYSTGGLGCGFFQPAQPSSPSRFRPLGLRGRKAESPASTRNSVVSIHNIARQVLDYSTRGVYLLRRSLSDLKLFGDALVCHVARPPRRRRQTSLQARRRIVDEGHIGQSRAAEPGPQLEPLLQRLLVLLVGRIFDEDGVITFADFAALFALPFPSSRIFTSRGGEASSETNFTMSSCNKYIG